MYLCLSLALAFPRRRTRPRSRLSPEAGFQRNKFGRPKALGLILCIAAEYVSTIHQNSIRSKEAKLR